MDRRGRTIRGRVKTFKSPRVIFVLLAAFLALFSQPGHASPGSYQLYDAKAFAEASSSHRVLFFQASWCPNCRKANEALQQMTLPDNVMVYKVDYDRAGDLKVRYGVTMLDTFVLVDAHGKKVAQWVGLENALAELSRYRLMPAVSADAEALNK